MFDWIGDFFKELLNLIPKLVYLLYTAFISLIDLLQLLFRKLAGLDVYYVNGEPIGGDLVTNFIQGILGIGSRYGSSSDFADRTDYSALSTVFWSFVIFGLVVCFVSTLIAIFKSHYTYNEKSAKGPMPIVASAGKAVLNMVAVPLIVVLGLWLSQAILTALDSFTSTTSDSIVSIFGTDAEGNSNAEQLLEPVEYRQNGVTYQTYLYYDMFGYTANIWYTDALSWVGDRIEDVLEVVSAYQPTEEDMARVAARTQTFSGSIFKVAAYNANRVRSGEYVTSDDYVNSNITGFGGGGLTLFTDYTTTEEAANMVDTSFANFLHLQNTYEVSYNTLPRERYFLNFTTDTVSSFSKFNVGLVWYYYDLWDFNFIVGFGAAIVCIVIFFNIILGLMTRFFLSIILFLVMPPLAGLAPLDNGKAFGTWRETFMKQVLMAYGAVVGMNLILLLLPYINRIDFFNIEIADLIVQTLFIIVGLITIKAAISTLSALIGAEDANATGDKINKEVGTVAGKAASMTVGAAKIAGKAFMNLTPAGIAAKTGMRAVGKGVGKVVNSKAARITGGAVSGFLKGGVTGARGAVEQVMAEDELKQAGKADLMESLDGMDLRGKNGKLRKGQIKAMAKAHGFTNSQATQLARAAEDSLNADGTINKDLLAKNYMVKRDMHGDIKAKNIGTGHEKYVKNDRAFAKYAGFKKDDYTPLGFATSPEAEVLTNTGARKPLSQRRFQDAQAIQAYARANPGVLGGAFRGIIGDAGRSGSDIAKQFMANFKTGIKQSDGVNEFLEKSGIEKKPDWAAQTAGNTRPLGEKMDALNKGITDLTNAIKDNKKP